MKVSLVLMCFIWILNCWFIVCQNPSSSSSSEGKESTRAFGKRSIFTETTSEQLTSDLTLYHQAIRRYHNLEPLVYSVTLERKARQRAMIISYWGVNTHPDDVGENIWFQANETVTNATTIIRGWYYQQLANYNYADPKIIPENQNFAQIVWKETNQIGCGQVYSTSFVSDPNLWGTYTVCHYLKPGLIPSQESDNIPLPAVTSPLSFGPKNLEATIENMVNLLRQDNQILSSFNEI